jgi:hypothetical protein
MDLPDLTSLDDAAINALTVDCSVWNDEQLAQIDAEIDRRTVERLRGGR